MAGQFKGRRATLVSDSIKSFEGRGVEIFGVTNKKLLLRLKVLQTKPIKVRQLIRTSLI